MIVHPWAARDAASLGCYADFRCGLAAGFFVAASLADFLPAIGISISFWPAAALRGFLPDFFGALVSAAAPPALRRSASITSPAVQFALRVDEMPDELIDQLIQATSQAVPLDDHPDEEDR
jgi:hypothetical protein